MNNKPGLAVILVLLMAWMDAAWAFSFCFSSGGGGNHRSRYFDGNIPAIGFRPDYWQGYPYNPVYNAWYMAPGLQQPAQEQYQQGDPLPPASH